MVGVQHHQNSLAGFDQGLDLGQDVRRGGGALDQVDPRLHRMGFYGLTVVGADLDVDPDDPALAHGFEQGGVEDQATAVGDAGFHQNVGL